MTTQQLEEFISNTNVEDFKDYYFNNGFDTTREHFNLSHGNLRYLVKFWDIKMTQENKNRLIKKCWQEKDTSYENKLNNYINSISKDDIIDYYITQNNNYEDTMKHFGLSPQYFFDILRHYDIKKDSTSHMELIKQTKLERYGDENYNNREKAVNTCIEKYGVDNVSRAPEVIEKIKINRHGNPDVVEKARKAFISTILEKYGTFDNYYRQKYLKTANTVMERYGVKSASQLDDVKDKIAKSLETTFMNKYGVSCYWLTDNSKRSFRSVHSKPNESFAQKLSENNINFSREFTIGKYSYDFKIDNILIEINPFATHNSTWSPFGDSPKSKYYHYDKTEIANNNGYRCINIWDWDDVDKIISSLKEKKKLYARNLQIKTINDNKTVDNFINENHFQGTCRNQSICIGLYDNEELIQIMTFGCPRYNKKFEYELLRLCTKCGYFVVGGAEKLFSYFIKEYSPNSIISYCDNSKFSGDVYEKLGFTRANSKSVSKHWYNPIEDIHITDNLLRQRGFDQLFNTNYGKGYSNTELMFSAGFVEIYDCGQSRYEYKIK